MSWFPSMGDLADEANKCQIATGTTTQPAKDFLALVHSTSYGKEVRKAIQKKFILRPVGSETLDELLDRITASYLQFIPSRLQDKVARNYLHIANEPCLAKVVYNISPTAREQEVQVEFDWKPVLIIGGAVAVAALFYFLFRAKKSSVSFPALPAPAASPALPVPLSVGAK